MMRQSMRKKICLGKLCALPALLAAAALLLSLHGVSAAEVLKVGGDCAYPPFIYQDSSGKLKGFDVDIADEIGRRLHKTVERQCVTWDGLIPGLLARRYDVIIAAMDITPERAKRVDFSIPYYRAPSVFVGLKALAATLPNKADKIPADFISGKTVGVLRASIYEKYLQAAYPGVQLTRYDSIDAALIDLKAGRIDLVFTDMPKAEADFLHKDGNGAFAAIGPQVKDYALLGEGSAAALRKGNEALRDAINAAIKAMMADGAYDKICRKYWSFSVKP